MTDAELSLELARAYVHLARLMCVKPEVIQREVRRRWVGVGLWQAYGGRAISATTTTSVSEDDLRF